MNIGIDTRIYGSPVMTGVQRYTEDILNQRELPDTKNNCYLFSDKEIQMKGSSSFSNIVLTHPSFGKKRSVKDLIMWTQFLLPDKLKELKIDLFHSPSMPLPLLPHKRCKLVLTIHDIIPWTGTDREIFSSAFTKYFKTWIEKSVRYADMILTVSEFSKKEICSLFNISPAKVTVIYNRASKFFSPITDNGRAKDDLKSNLGISGPFILTVGTVTPRKNIPFLADTFLKTKKRRLIPHKLVICGSTDFFKPGIKPSKDIIFTGPVSDKLLLALYHSADLCVFPSLYEGFGYPVVEAMACRTPVLVSDKGSFPEITGNSDMIFKGDSSEDLQNKIIRMIEDKEFRNRIIEHGLKRALFFDTAHKSPGLNALYRKIPKNGA